jgi:hypothetical protein
MLQAVQLRQLAEYAAVTGLDEYTSDELAMVLCMTMNTACKRLDLALDLTQRLPATLAAMGVASSTGGVAEIIGYGVITDSQALAAHDATWRRLLTDPHSGMLTDYGRPTYVPPVALTDFVRALDHRVPFPKGATSVDNLAAICRHHHRMKHRAGWTVRRRADGAHVWISPQEREYLNPPIPLGQPVAVVMQAPPDCTPPPF